MHQFFEPVFDTFTFDSYQGGVLVAKQFIEFAVKDSSHTWATRKMGSRITQNGFKDTIEKEGKKIGWDYRGDYSF